ALARLPGVEHVLAKLAAHRKAQLPVPEFLPALAAGTIRYERHVTILTCGMAVPDGPSTPAAPGRVRAASFPSSTPVPSPRAAGRRGAPSGRPPAATPGHGPAPAPCRRARPPATPGPVPRPRRRP